MGAVMSGQRPDRVPDVPFVQGYASKIIGKSIGNIYADAGDVEGQYGDTHAL